MGPANAASDAYAAQGTLVDTKLQGQTVRHLVDVKGVELKIDELYAPDSRRGERGQPVTVSVSRRQVHELPR